MAGMWKIMGQTISQNKGVIISCQKSVCAKVRRLMLVEGTVG